MRRFVEGTLPKYVAFDAAEHLTRKTLQKTCQDPGNIYCCKDLKNARGIAGTSEYCEPAVGYKARYVRTNEGYYKPVNPDAEHEKAGKASHLQMKSHDGSRKSRVTIPSSPSRDREKPVIPNPMREIIHDYGNTRG